MNIKGSSIRSKLKFEAEVFGEEAERALRLYLREHHVLAVLEASWYPYELYDGVLRWIAARHYGGELRCLREVGRFSARHALTSTYEIYLKRGDFPAFLRRITSLHSRYYDVGGLAPQVIEDGHAELRLQGAPFYREPDLQVAAGFYSGAAAMMGGRQVECQFSLGTNCVDFRLDWKSDSEESGIRSGIA